MPLGDGSQWDETNPQQSTEANTIDSYNRDMRVGTRIRMSAEHVWPSSQTNSNQAGYHTYITLQSYTAFPGFATTSQVGGLWVDSTFGLNFNNGTNYPLLPSFTDYGTSPSTGTPVVSYKIVRGVITPLVTNPGATITGLPFSNGTSYNIAGNVISTSANGVVFFNLTGSSFEMNISGTQAPVMWTAIGY